MSRNIPHLQSYGIQLLQQFPEISASRKIGSIPDNLPLPLNLKQHIVSLDMKYWIATNLLPLHFSISRTETIYRETGQEFEMGWHIDDCSVIKHSKNAEFNNPNNLLSFIAGGKYAIYFKGDPNDRPQYTFILYYDSIHQDFEGGVFEFADNVKVEPLKGQYIFFDSREVHKVHRVRSGTRRNLLIKFYGSLHLGS